jgi:hypothetical protein
MTSWATRDEDGISRSAISLDREQTTARSRTPHSGVPRSELTSTTDPCSERMVSK